MLALSVVNFHLSLYFQIFTLLLSLFILTRGFSKGFLCQTWETVLQMLPCPLSNIQLEQQTVSANIYFPSILQIDKKMNLEDKIVSKVAF